MPFILLCIKFLSNSHIKDKLHLSAISLALPNFQTMRQREEETDRDVGVGERE